MSCRKCGGAGWTIRTVGGLEGAERCECNPLPTKIKPAIQDIIAVLAKIAESKTIPFFPDNELGFQFLAVDIRGYVEDMPSLRLFAEKLITHGKPYEGAHSLRRIYCAFCTPADGYYPEPLPGFETEALESRHKMLELESRDQEIIRYRQEALQAPAADRTPFTLPPVKGIE